MDDDEFAVRVRDARHGGDVCEVLVPRDAATVAELKTFVRQRHAPARSCTKLHVAHAGNIMDDGAPLETLRAAPIVVLAVVMPPPPRTTPVALPTPALLPVGAPAAAHPNTEHGARRRMPSIALPSREAVAAAWERAFPAAAEPTAPPAAQDEPPQAAPAEEEEPVCRVCFCGTEAGPLLAPCRCRGSMRLVHQACLNEWRIASANPRSFGRCETCGFSYRTERTRWGDVLQDERVHSAATVVALLVLLFIGALLPFRPERLLYRLLRWQPALTLPWWTHTCDTLVRAVALPAAGGMALSIRHAQLRHRGLPFEQQTWAAALLLSLANDALVARPILAGGLLYFSAHLAHEVRSQARRLFVKVGERILDLNDLDVPAAPAPASRH